MRLGERRLTHVQDWEFVLSLADPFLLAIDQPLGRRTISLLSLELSHPNVQQFLGLY